MENVQNPLIGGIIIGVASTMMLAFNGKITGISGIIGGALKKITKDDYWRIAFILGLIFGAFVLYVISPHLFQYEFKNSYLEMIMAGVLVGYGTRLGSGCTSGHGVCGLPRFSARSLTATLTFMAVAVITVFIRNI